MKSIIFFLLICLISLLSLQACSPASPPTEAAPELVKINVQLLPFAGYAPIFIADKEGFFAEQGLEVEYIKVFAEEAVVALASGKLDVAATVPSVPLLNAIAQEPGMIKIVSDKGFIDPQGCVINGIIARKSLVDAGELKDVAQLKGKVIAGDPVSVEGYFLDKLLSSAGLTMADIESVDFDDSATVIDSFEQGTLDLAIQSEPWITRINNTGTTVTWKGAWEEIPDFPYAVIIFGTGILKDNPDKGQRFINAYLKAVKQYNEGKTEKNSAHMIEATGMEKELVEQMCWPVLRSDGTINHEQLAAFQQWAVENKYMEAEVTQEVYWDGSFLAAASK